MPSVPPQLWGSAVKHAASTLTKATPAPIVTSVAGHIIQWGNDTAAPAKRRIPVLFFKASKPAAVKVAAPVVRKVAAPAPKPKRTPIPVLFGKPPGKSAPPVKVKMGAQRHGPDLSRLMAEMARHRRLLDEGHAQPLGKAMTATAPWVFGGAA